MAGDGGRIFNGIVIIVDEFWFDDGNEAGGLTDFGVFGEDAGVFGDGVICRSDDFAVFRQGEIKGSTPFGEANTHLIVFAETFSEAI